MATRKLTPEERAAKNAYMRAWTHEWLARRTPEELEQHRIARRAYGRKWYADHLESKRAHDRELQAKRRAADPERHRRHLQAWRDSHRIATMVSQAKSRAKKKGIPFDDLSELARSKPTHCACCGTPFDYTERNRRDRRAPSLDRHDNSKGYTLDNVRIICMRCNFVKGNTTLEELKMIVAYMEA